MVRDRSGVRRGGAHPDVRRRTTPAFLVLQSLAFVVLFTAVAVAVLKYRLYDIDVVINKTVVYASLAAFFTAVYVAVVVGLGTAIGSTHDPFLTVAAAAVIAVAFNPVRERARRLADRLVYGKRATPYEVLSEFSEHMAGTYALDDILPRMARVLAEGTGGRAEIWLRVGDRLRAGVRRGRRRAHRTRPSADLAVVDEDLPRVPGRSKATPVLHRGELLGAIAVTKPANDPLRPAEEKLIDDLASQAGLVLFNVAADRGASRLAPAPGQGAGRGAPPSGAQHPRRRAAAAGRAGGEGEPGAVDREPRSATRLELMLGQLKAEATDALENLRDLARGIYPPLLADKGLAAALESQARKSSVPVALESDGVERYPQEVEAAVYFCCLEALQNIAKYAEATHGDDPPGRRDRHARVRGDRRRPWVRSRFDRLRHRAPGDGRPARRVGWVAGGSKHAGAGNDRRGAGAPVLGHEDREPEIVALEPCGIAGDARNSAPCCGPRSSTSPAAIPHSWRSQRRIINAVSMIRC